MSSSLRVPCTYVFGFLLSDHERKELEDELEAIGVLQYTIQEAEIGLTKIPTKARVKYELRKIKVMMVDVTNGEGNTEKVEEANVEVKEEVGKKRKAETGKEKVRRITLNEDGNEIIELSSSGGEIEDLEEEKGENLNVARKKAEVS
ncbi:hypothetical protein DID88_006554 [Monilinia fructigena]|uniref:Uncharacterized protein n=1 Tax=Monilinia fructigena TaxID=38457 RepID=A0A395IHA5_9HELO|nr:hypothetical protein DID88_006554 [Monilinia fructigena]